jgi:hypothetical protein
MASGAVIIKQFVPVCMEELEEKTAYLVIHSRSKCWNKRPLSKQGVDMCKSFHVHSKKLPSDQHNLEQDSPK